MKIDITTRVEIKHENSAVSYVECADHVQVESMCSSCVFSRIDNSGEDHDAYYSISILFLTWLSHHVSCALLRCILALFLVVMFLGPPIYPHGCVLIMTYRHDSWASSTGMRCCSRARSARTPCASLSWRRGSRTLAFACQRCGFYILLITKFTVDLSVAWIRSWAEGAIWLAGLVHFARPSSLQGGCTALCRSDFLTANQVDTCCCGERCFFGSADLVVAVLLWAVVLVCSFLVCRSCSSSPAAF